MMDAKREFECVALQSRFAVIEALEPRLMLTATVSFLPAAAVGSLNFPSAIAVADFYGDGKQDLAVATQASDASVEINVYHGNGDGTFATTPVSTVLPGSVNSLPILAAGDLSGTGRIDLAVDLSDTGTIYALASLHNGAFVVNTLSTTAQADAITIGNVTGRPDIILDGVNTGIVIIPSVAGGTFGTAITLADSRTNLMDAPNSIIAVDVNGDGKMDLISTYPDTTDMNGNTVQGAVAVRLGNGNGTFQSPMFLTAGSSPDSVATGDFNHDGKVDLAVANHDGNNISIFTGNGNGTFAVGTIISLGTSFDAPTSIAVTDLNGDGNLDLVVADEQNNHVVAASGNGDGTFVTSANDIFTAGASNHTIAVADLNGDGQPDLVVGANAGVGTAPVQVLIDNTRHVMDTRYVNQLFQDVLGRSPSAGDLATFVAYLDSGHTFGQLATAFTGTREYDGDLVDNLYVTYLGRHSDALGLTGWVDLLQQGYNLENIRAFILGSDEYYNRTGGTPDAYITALFQAFLHRSPNQADLNAWGSILGNTTHTHSVVASGISNSDENRTDIITNFYQMYLNRAPDSGGLSLFKSLLAQGVSQPQILAFFLTAPEYLQHHNINT